jgi:hypothetical protein
MDFYVKSRFPDFQQLINIPETELDDLPDCEDNTLTEIEHFIIDELSFKLDDLIHYISIESDFFVNSDHSSNVKFLISCLKYDTKITKIY